MYYVLWSMIFVSSSRLQLSGTGKFLTKSTHRGVTTVTGTGCVGTASEGTWGDKSQRSTSACTVSLCSYLAEPYKSLLFPLLMPCENIHICWVGLVYWSC